MGLEESLALLNQSLKRYQALNYLAKKDQNYKNPAVNKLFTTQCKEIELYLAIAECKRLMSTQVNEDWFCGINILKEAESACQVAYACVRGLEAEFRDRKKNSRTLCRRRYVLQQLGTIYAQSEAKYFASKEQFESGIEAV